MKNNSDKMKKHLKRFMSERESKPYSKLEPISVPSCVKTANKLTTKHFNIRQDNFIFCG